MAGDSGAGGESVGWMQGEAKLVRGFGSDPVAQGLGRQGSSIL